MIKNNFIRFFLIFSFSILVNFSLAEEFILGKDGLIFKPVSEIRAEEKTNDVEVTSKTPEVRPSGSLEQIFLKATETKLNLSRKIILVDKINIKTGELVRLNIANNFSEKLNNIENIEIKLQTKNNIYQKINLKHLEEMSNLQNLDPRLFQNFGFSLF